MNITKVNIKKISEPKEGLVGFASLVLNDCLYIGNIAIFSRLNQDTYRLVFPEKKLKDDKVISLVYPLTSEFYFELEEKINNQIKQNGFE